MMGRLITCRARILAAGCKCTAEDHRLLNHWLLKHKGVVFVTTRFVALRQLPRPTGPFSFLSLLRQFRGLRKIRSWNRPCAEGASNRNWNMWSDCGVARHRGRGDYCGDPLSVCVLDVGASDFLLYKTSSNDLSRRDASQSRYYAINVRVQIIAGGRRGVKYEIGMSKDKSSGDSDKRIMLVQRSINSHLVVTI